MQRSHLFCSLLVIGLGLTGQAAKANRADPVWTDPNKAADEDVDFRFQGEYGINKKGQAWAVQVVALGDGRFDGYLLEGGLPGLGWDRKRTRIKLSGVRQGDTVTLASSDGTFKAKISEGCIVVGREGKQIADLPRLIRKSLPSGPNRQRGR